MKSILKATFLGAITQSAASGASVFGPGHMDLRLNYSAGVWTSEMRHDGTDSTIDSGPGSGSITVPANTGSVIFTTEEQSLTRPPGLQWDFLGTPAGADVWIFPATQNVQVPFLGMNTEATPSSGLGVWDPAHTAVASGKWVEVRLLNMRYTGESVTPNFSMWTIQSGSTPNVWMSTANGIATDGTDDGYYMIPGGHAHMNWGFNALGIYDLTFQGITTLAGNEQSVSDPFTLRFGIGAIPEPSTAVLCLGSCLLTLLKRRRPCEGNR